MNRSITRKRRTREHIIADLSVNFVERQILLCGHTAERTRFDYGYDLSLTTYNISGEPETGEIRLQLKATDTLPLSKDKTNIPWKILRTDLARWLYDPAPVILVVYDAKVEEAYWLYVQQHFQRLPRFSIFRVGQSVTVHVPKANVLDQSAVKQFGLYRDTALRQRGESNHDLT